MVSNLLANCRCSYRASTTKSSAVPKPAVVRQAMPACTAAVCKASAPLEDL